MQSAYSRFCDNAKGLPCDKRLDNSSTCRRRNLLHMLRIILDFPGSLQASIHVEFIIPDTRNPTQLLAETLAG